MRKTSTIGILFLAVVLLTTGAYAATSGPSPIPPPPNFQISTSAVTLCKGMINAIPVTIRTPRGASVMQNVQLSLGRTNAAYSVGNGTVSAFNVTANLSKTVQLLVFVGLNASPLISTGISVNYQ